MDDRIAAALALLPERLGQHVLLSAAALALGLAVSLPLAVVAARRPRLRWAALTVAGLIQTIPGLALLALFYPLLLAVSALTVRLFGLQTPALGFLPALFALGLYSMLPILRNTVAGLTGIDPAVTEAADGVGMTPTQRLWRVEAPLAAPVVMAGVRTAAVWTVGAATLSTPVGQTSLGDYIFAGLQTEDWVSVLFGCFAAAGLALVADQMLGLIEAGVARRDRGRAGVGLAGLVLGVVLAAMAVQARAPGAGTAASPVYVIGAKNFSEQFILAELMGQRIRAAGGQVRRKDGLGSAVIFRALASGEIDAYVDYSGTLWTNVLGRRDTPPRQAMLAALTDELARRYGVTVLGPLGFENAYALAMRQDRARQLGIGDIAGLSRRAPGLVLGSDLEFLSRPEWAALKGAYGLNFKTQRSYNPTFMYRALEDGEADVISAFSSDGRISARRLLVLADPKGAIPPYDAVILLSPRRAHDVALRRALQPLVGAVPVERMRQANLMVDRDEAKSSPAQAAQWLAGGIRR
jgi:osmoprotectant transport system permease protein